jgi:hypothetical protein
LQIKTNLFDYNDQIRIKKSCEIHNVVLASNMKKVALVGEDSDVHNVLKDCFDKYCYKIVNDTLLLNM